MKIETGGLRNETPLTDIQKATVLSYAVLLGMSEKAILFSDNMNPSYTSLFGEERLYIEKPYYWAAFCAVGQ